MIRAPPRLPRPEAGIHSFLTPPGNLITSERVLCQKIDQGAAFLLVEELVGLTGLDR